jgi:ABC-type bacteriocin/lantibiotic exporter with double-glycine peptidase domain
VSRHAGVRCRTTPSLFVAVQVLHDYSFVKHCLAVWGHCRGYHRQVVTYLLLSVVVAFFGMAPPYLISWYIDKLTK